MTKQPVDGQKIRDYLLGILPDTETEHFDELSFTDPAFAAELDAAEHDLVDAYVNDELSGEVLARFKSYYMASSRRREKVAFAQTFQPKVRQTAVNEERPKVMAFKRFRVPVGGWALAAVAALMLLAGGYVVRQNALLQSEVSVAAAKQQALQKRQQELLEVLARQNTEDRQTREELARVQQQLAQVEQQMAQGATPQPNQEVTLLAFNLEPQSREAMKMKTLEVGQSTDFVVLNLGLEIKSFPAYKAILKDPRTGAALWSSLRLKYDGASDSIPVALPADVLKSQNYLLELSGITPEGKSTVITAYLFRAARR